MAVGALGILSCQFFWNAFGLFRLLAQEEQLREPLAFRLVWRALCGGCSSEPARKWESQAEEVDSSHACQHIECELAQSLASGSTVPNSERWCFQILKGDKA